MKRGETAQQTHFEDRMRQSFEFARCLDSHTSVQAQELQQVMLPHAHAGVAPVLSG